MIITIELPELAPAFGYDTGDELYSYFYRGINEYYKNGEFDINHFVTTFDKRGKEELGNKFKSKWTDVVAAMCKHPNSPIMDMKETTGDKKTINLLMIFNLLKFKRLMKDIRGIRKIKIRSVYCNKYHELFKY